MILSNRSVNSPTSCPASDHADYADPSEDPLDPETVRDLVEIDRSDTQAFRIRAAEGHWENADELMEGTDVPFDLFNVAADSGGGRLSVSVSVRQAEVLDGPCARAAATGRAPVRSASARRR